MSDHMSSREARLLATDFDNSYAMTFEASPGGMTVALAYDQAIEKLFGIQGLISYRASGGLKNRAPGEVIAELAPNLEQPERLQKTEDLIEVKLSLLCHEVGRRLPDGSFWPKVAPGFTGVWQRASQDQNMHTAVISSGHRNFIKRFHDLHELALPDHMLTDDDLRHWAEHMSMEKLTKPSPLLMETIHRQWLQKLGRPLGAPLWESKQSILYAGDDPIKDGEMAENYGVRFVQIDPVNPTTGWQEVETRLYPEFRQAAA